MSLVRVAVKVLSNLICQFNLLWGTREKGSYTSHCAGAGQSHLVSAPLVCGWRKSVFVPCLRILHIKLKVPHTLLTLLFPSFVCIWAVYSD